MSHNKKVFIITGHYGTGKTNVCINLAVRYAKSGLTTAVCDLDVINPYFKTADARYVFEQYGISFLEPKFANTNLDIPALPASIDAIFAAEHDILILDVGGDDAGAFSLGRYRDKIKTFNYEMYYVINKYRPMISEHDDAVYNLRDIEAACKLKATGIINNSNLGTITVYNDIVSSFKYAKEISKETGLPVVYTGIKEELVEDDMVGDILAMKLYTKKYW